MTLDNAAAESLPERRHRVLIVAWEKGSAADLAKALRGNGFDCEIARPEHAPQRMIDVAPGLVVLDVPVVAPDSLALCENLPARFDVPVVICSFSSREQDIVRALEAGADDYLVLPMSPSEMRARLRAILRRSGGHEQATGSSRDIVVGDLRVSPDEHRVYRRGSPVELSPIEFRLLASLLQENGRLVSHQELLERVWGPGYGNSRHYLRLYVRYLRSKLEDDPEAPERIVNEWGVGYRFQAQPG